MKINEIILEGTSPNCSLWMQAMKHQGAVKFERIEMDTLVAKDADGHAIGYYDRQKDAAIND